MWRGVPSTLNHIASESGAFSPGTQTDSPLNNASVLESQFQGTPRGRGRPSTRRPPQETPTHYRSIAPKPLQLEPPQSSMEATPPLTLPQIAVDDYSNKGITLPEGSQFCRIAYSPIDDCFIIMEITEHGGTPRWRVRRRVPRKLELNENRECKAGVTFISNHYGTVSLEALYSKSERYNYICQEEVHGLGWFVHSKPLPPRALNRWSTNANDLVIKPVGWITLLVQQRVAPHHWVWIDFHVLEKHLAGYPSRIVISETATDQLLGNTFPFRLFNSNPEAFEQLMDDATFPPQLQDMRQGLESQPWQPGGMIEATRFIQQSQPETIGRDSEAEPWQQDVIGAEGQELAGAGVWAYPGKYVQWEQFDGNFNPRRSGYFQAMCTGITENNYQI